MARKTEVLEILDLCRSVGLDPIKGASGHYKVNDPKTGAYLFSISNSPGDPNWKWEVMRHLRRTGYLQVTSSKRRLKGRPSKVDLDALRIAQERAAGAGQRVPTLEDLEGSTEFFASLKEKAKEGTHFPTQIEAKEKLLSRGIDIEASFEEWMCDLVSPEHKAEADFVRGRLKKFFEEHSVDLSKAASDRLLAEGGRSLGDPSTGRGAKTEFVRTAIVEVGPKRDIQSFKNIQSGQMAIGKFLDGQGLRPWAVDLVSATLDHYDGLQWGKTPTVPIESTNPVADETEPTADEIARDMLDKHKQETRAAESLTREQLMAKQDELEFRKKEREKVYEVELVAEATFQDEAREKYLNALLEILASEKESIANKEPILDRIDKLVGLS